MKNNIEKEKILTNFKKTKTLLERIISMMQEDKYCIEIMQQNLAAIGLLKSAHQSLMENHLNTCFTKAIQSENTKKKEEMIKEILTVTKLSNR